MFRDLLMNRLAPFKNKNFSLFFFVQTLSSTGKWSHDLARAWIIVEMYEKAGPLGTLMFASAIPPLFLILHGGVVVDRSNVQKLMTLTKALLAVACIVLAGVYYFSNIQFWHLLVFAVIEGCIRAFDSPAFQAVTVRLVEKQDFQQALALNSMNFHFSRALGPLVAGILMAWSGPGVVFLFDGLSFLLVSFVLTRISLKNAEISKPTAPKLSSLESLKQGIRYVFTTPSLRYKLLQLILAISILVPVIMVIFRAYMADKFQLTDQQFGYLFIFPALGSALGSLSFTVIKPKRPLRALWIGIPGATFGIIAVAFAPTIYWAGILMMLNGFATYLSFVSITVSLHMDVLEEYRGRMSSMIGMGFLCIAPLMSFPMGHLADFYGYQPFIVVSAIVFISLSVILYFCHWRTWESVHSTTPTEA